MGTGAVIRRTLVSMTQWSGMWHVPPCQKGKSLRILRGPTLDVDLGCPDQLPLLTVRQHGEVP